jgi:prepilin-type N-terminal cleavage/methylation domain-containing protein
MPVFPAENRHRTVRRQGGFTLIELMVVVFIVGLLIALTVKVIPAVLRAAHGAQTSAQMTAIATSIQAYYNDFRAYPGPLPNNEVGAAYYPTANYTASYPQGAFITDPNTSSPVTLQLGTGALGSSETFGTFTQNQQITGAENLVLGLLGGLELKVDSTSTPYTIKTFAYSDASIYPDGVTAAPLGPMSLNPNAPKRLGAYIQVRTGDLSNSRNMGTPTVFQDSATRMASDSPIPEFLDKYSNPMPILYLRANVGASGVVTYGQKNEAGKTQTAAYQYDLAQVLGYTTSAIGTVSGLATSHHGLQDIMPTGTTTPAADTAGGDFAGSGTNETPNLGANAFAYLKDPNTPLLQSDNTTATTNFSAHPRQKDAFILISAGPDGLYGTPDDIVYPGGTVSGQ